MYNNHRLPSKIKQISIGFVLNVYRNLKAILIEHQIS